MLPRLQESEVSVNGEEEEAREHDGRVANTNMEHEEEDEDNVEVVSVEEELEHFSSDSWNRCGPQE